MAKEEKPLTAKQRLAELEKEYVTPKELYETDFSKIFADQVAEIDKLKKSLSESTISEVQQPGVLGTKSNTGTIIFFAIVAMVVLLTQHKVAGIKL